MELRSVETSPKQEEKFSAVYSALQSSFKKASSAVHESRTLSSIGVYDDLFKMIEKAQNDPLGIISDKLTSDFTQIKNFLDGIVSAFVEENSEAIKDLEKVPNNSSHLCYYIVLKEDSIATRKPFLKFLYDYEQRSISDKFPIFFDFMSQPILDEIRHDSLK